MKSEFEKSTASRPLVLILCTGNSCRSQMAEGILCAAAGDSLEVHSAGSNPAGFVHPLAVQAMVEIGIDMSGYRSKNLNEFLERPVETVITVCAAADAACPVFPGQLNRHHWPFDDPAKATGHEVEQMRGGPVGARGKSACVQDLRRRPARPSQSARWTRLAEILNCHLKRPL